MYNCNTLQFWTLADWNKIHVYIYIYIYVIYIKHIPLIRNVFKPGPLSQKNSRWTRKKAPSSDWRHPVRSHQTSKQIEDLTDHETGKFIMDPTAGGPKNQLQMEL